MTQGQFEYFQMRCFVAVAEELSFRRAAERLNMTQPPLSRQIKNLEERVNLILLERSNRHVALTSAGESFYHSALEIIKRSEIAILNARQAERGELGNISIGFVPSAAMKFVPLVALQMAENLPDVHLNPVEMMGYEIVEALRSNKIDFGLARMEHPGGEFERTQVVSEPFTLALNRKNHLANLENLSISHLDGKDYVAYSKDRGGFLVETLNAMFASCGVLPKTRIEASQTHAVMSMVNHGLGFALVPRSARVMQMENIVFRDIEMPKQVRSDMYLVSRSGQNSALRTRVKTQIIDALAQFRAQD